MFQDTFADEQQLPRRHPVRRFFFRLFLVLVVLIAAGAVYVWRFQPLSVGDTYGVRGEQVRETESVGGSSVVTYGAGEGFEMLFSIRNAGLVPVRVTAVPDSELASVLATYDVTVMPRGDMAFDPAQAQAFRPFALRPGEERLLNLSYRFKDCGAPAAAGNRTVRRQAVRYELVQRLERTADVRLAQPVVIARLPLC